MQFSATVASRTGGDSKQDFPIRRMYNFGSATRDPQTAVAHQEEVAKSGIYIAFDVPAPRIYPIGRHSFTMEDEVFVQTEKTSGEVEIVLHMADQLYVGVGSDHTDRALETVSIPGSKQACPNHLAGTLWPYAEIADHWDECVLKAWVDDRLYQDVSVAAFMKPEVIIDTLRERVGGVPDRDFTVFCGTIVSVDKALGFGAHWKYSLEDPVTSRNITGDYDVVNILSEVRDGFQVPFFNPQKQ